MRDMGYIFYLTLMKFKCIMWMLNQVPVRVLISNSALLFLINLHQKLYQFPHQINFKLILKQGFRS